MVVYVIDCLLMRSVVFNFQFQCDPEVNRSAEIVLVEHHMGTVSLRGIFPNFD